MPTLATTTPSEDRVQASIVEWLRLVLPHALVSSVPLGGLRSKREAAKLKWTGALAGIPDLFVALPAGRVIWVECKRVGGALSPEQRVVHASLADLGHTVIVARNVEDVRAALRILGVPTREAA